MDGPETSRRGPGICAQCHRPLWWHILRFSHSHLVISVGPYGSQPWGLFSSTICQHHPDNAVLCGQPATQACGTGWGWVGPSLLTYRSQPPSSSSLLHWAELQEFWGLSRFLQFLDVSSQEVAGPHLSSFLRKTNICVQVMGVRWGVLGNSSNDGAVGKVEAGVPAGAATNSRGVLNLDGPSELSRIEARGQDLCSSTKKNPYYWLSLGRGHNLGQDSPLQFPGRDSADSTESH